MDRKKQIRKDKGLIITICFTVFIFLILYRKAVFFGYTVFYSDIGTDTIQQYYLNALFDRQQLRQGNIYGYSFANGLGRSNFSLGYINIVQWIYYFLPEKYFHVTFLIGILLAFILSSCSGYLIFKHFKYHDITAIVGGLLWAFSGYLVLWGQHFDFGAAYASISIYVLLLVKCNFWSFKDTYSVILGLVLIGLTANSYYWLYMTGICSAIYIAIYNAYKNNAHVIIKRLVFLLGDGLFAALICAFKILPGVVGYLNSSRTSAVTAEKSPFGIVYNKQVILTDIARFFSNDFLGTGDNYSGYYNYYEGTILCVSALTMIALFNWLFCGDRRKELKRGSVLLLIAFFLLFTPFTKYLTFNVKKQRWTFALIFFFIWITVSYFESILFDKIDKKKIVLNLILADMVDIFLYIILTIAHYHRAIDIDKKVAIYVIIVTVVYNIFIISILFLRDKEMNAVIRLCFLLAISIEMIFNNNSSINHRKLLTVAEYQALHDQSTESTIKKVMKDDPELYRIQKNYTNFSLNEGKIQNYNSVMDYNATPNASVGTYMYNNDVPFAVPGEYSRASKYISVPADDYVVSTLLGCKYLISDHEIQDDNYILKGKVENRWLYYNKNSLPFGYLYTSQIPKQQYLKLDKDEKRKVLQKSFYYTDQDQRNSNVSQGYKDKSDVPLWNDLKNGVIKDTYHNNIYYAEVYAESTQGTMFCVPIFYDHNWQIYVDGQRTPSVNINGGLTGVALGNGCHRIKIVYNDTLFTLSVIISLISVLFFGVLFLVSVHKKAFDKSSRTPIIAAVATVAVVGMIIVIMIPFFKKVYTRGRYSKIIKNGDTIFADSDISSDIPKDVLLFLESGSSEGLAFDSAYAKGLLVIDKSSTLNENLKQFGFIKEGQIGDKVLYRYTSLNNLWKITQFPGQSGLQSMGYSIEDLKGHLYLVDGGRNEDASYVRHVITTHANRVNAWFLTHPHTDHVNAFSSILESSDQLPRIDTIFASQFDAERYKKTAAPEDVYSDYLRMNKALSKTGLEERVHYIHKGDSIALHGLSVKCFHDYTSKVGGNACNDGSLMFKISGKKKSMLFCGDIQSSQTDVITNEFGQELSCNYIQMSHHGNSGLGSAFYKKAAATGNLEVAFFDAPEWLFHPAKGTNFTTEETRKLMKSLGAKNVYFKTAPNSVLLQ